MKYLLTIGLTLLLCISTVQAEVSTSGLTKTQAAELSLEAAKLRAGNLAPAASMLGDVDVEQVEKWANLGTSIGKGLASAAKEMGQEVNTFASSGVGLLATTVIVWTYIGSDVVLVVFALFWFLIVAPVWTTLFFKYRKPIIETNSWTEPDTNKKVTKHTYRSSLSESQLFGWWFSGLTVALVGIIAIVNI